MYSVMKAAFGSRISVMLVVGSKAGCMGSASSGERIRA